MTKKCGCCEVTLGLGLVSGIILVAAGIFLFYELDPIVRDEIKKKVVISNTSETYDIWSDIPLPVYMQFWVFDVQNVEDILAGGKPNVTQKGPYTYREYRPKFDIVWNPNGTVTYKQNRTFFFVPEMSYESDDELVTTVNPLLPVISEGMKYWPSFVKSVVGEVLKSFAFKEGLFMSRPVKEVLWGYEDPALQLLKTLILSFFDRSVIGYFIRKNYTDDGVYTVFTGADNISNLGYISRWNGNTKLDLWTTEYANMINGSDGTLGPPFKFDAKFAPVFVSDICRSIRGIYMEDVYVKDIRLYRFGGDKLDMANATVNPDNIGFCTPQDRCLPTGLLNSTLCQEEIDHFKLPIIFSFPNFLFADPRVQDSVHGVFPDLSQHQTLIDAEPWTGLVLQVAKRLQINIFVEKVEGMVQTANVRTLFFPVVWLNESSVVDDKHADMLKDELFNVKKLAEIGRIVAVAVGGVLILLSTALWIRRRRQIAKYSVNTEKSNSLDSQRSPLLRTSSSHLYDDPVTPHINPVVRESPRSDRAASQISKTSYGSVVSTDDSLHSLPDSKTSGTPQSIPPMNSESPHRAPGSNYGSPRSIPASDYGSPPSMPVSNYGSPQSNYGSPRSLPASTPETLKSISVSPSDSMHSLPGSGTSETSGNVHSDLPQSNSGSMYSIPDSDTGSTTHLVQC